MREKTDDTGTAIIRVLCEICYIRNSAQSGPPATTHVLVDFIAEGTEGAEGAEIFLMSDLPESAVNRSLDLPYQFQVTFRDAPPTLLSVLKGVPQNPAHLQQHTSSLIFIAEGAEGAEIFL